MLPWLIYVSNTIRSDGQPRVKEHNWPLTSFEHHVSLDAEKPEVRDDGGRSPKSYSNALSVQPFSSNET